jgi:hypothetical protein
MINICGILNEMLNQSENFAAGMIVDETTSDPKRQSCVINNCVKYTLLWCFVTLLLSCGDKQFYGSPVEYDLSNPEKKILSDNLFEISDITFLPNTLDSILAINDEDGKIFLLPLKKGKASSFKFSRDGDYEDITVHKQSIFVLESKGKISSFAKRLSKEKIIGRKWEQELPEGEYESIFATQNTFYVLCKTCKNVGRDSVLGFVFSLINDTTFTSFEPFAIRRDINHFWPKNGLMPSALAKNILNDEWFIVSATNKLLVITDNKWKIKNVYRLDPAIFQHPEGMAFDELSNLYISNEGDETRNGNILKFERVP